MRSVGVRLKRYGSTAAYVLLILIMFVVAYLYQQRDDDRCASSEDNIQAIKDVVDAITKLATTSVQPSRELTPEEQERYLAYMERVHAFQTETKAKLSVPDYCK